MATQGEGPGIRTRVLLLASLFAIMAASTVASLFIVRVRLAQHVRDDLAMDLQHSLDTFQDLEGRRRAALERESRLLASLPSLKALMTTRDRRTIADSAVDFWKLSGNDLFALTDAQGQLLTSNAATFPDTATLSRDLQASLQQPERHYLVSQGHIFAYSVQPLIFGPAGTGTLLGYVVNGYAVDHSSLLQIARGAGAQAALVAQNSIVVSTWPISEQSSLQRQIATFHSSVPTVSRVDQKRFLAVSRDLSAQAAVPLRLILFKSFETAERAGRDIDQLLLLSSVIAVVAGSALMILLAGTVTRPLERLADGVRAFGAGDAAFSLPSGGPREVRFLSRIFARMREENRETAEALLEAERLATIGRMASSVSHDLRHYLAAIYANAEFLAAPTLPAAERIELFEEIRLAVHGTADMLDALLLFGRTGHGLCRVPTALGLLAERAAALVRAHPDAIGVSLMLEHGDPDTRAALDVSQVERAIFNLLLNACQSAHHHGSQPEVRAVVFASSLEVGITVQDNGAGVPEDIRDRVFAPFVSRGKQKGTGLGLTLAASVAREHGGTVAMLRSAPGETVFRLTLSRHDPLCPAELMQETGSTELAL